MTTLLLSQRISADELNNNEAVVVLHTQAALEQYKMISEVISTVEVNKKEVRKMSLKAMMQESVFHGTGRFGQNFIA